LQGIFYKLNIYEYHLITMGSFQCNTEKKDDYLRIIIERKMDNKDTTLDKKIHNEILRIKGLMEYKFDIDDNEVIKHI
jgi:hypothetical protein